MKMKKRKIRLIFFDMEGVILKKVHSGDKVLRSVWAKLSNSLGEQSWIDYCIIYEKWKKGNYKSYIKWVEDFLEIYVKQDLKKKLFEKVVKDLQYTQGTKEVFKKLKEKGIKTAIISGGFKEQVDLVVKELKVSHSTAACELRWDKNGNLDSWNILPFDEKGKKAIISLIRKDYGFKKKECAFVGNGRNDIYAAKSVGTSIAFNADPKLQKVSKFIINQQEGKENLKETLKYL